MTPSTLILEQVYPAVVESGPLIRNARTRAGLSQHELARRALTSQPAVNRYERGRVQPRADVLQRLLAACGTDLADTSAADRPLLGPIGLLLVRHRDEVLGRVAAVGATNVRVFGSVARADDTDESDLDLLVDLAPGRTILDLAHLSRELGELLGISVDVATLEILKPHIRERALVDARRL